MCNPALLAVSSLVVGVASAGASYMQQSQAADRQNQYYEMNKVEANRALVNTYAGQQNQRLQERNASSQKEFQTSLEATRARATAVTAAGQAGVSGLSVDALLSDYDSRESQSRDAIDQNYQMQSSAIDANMAGSKAQAISRINAAPQATPPSFADAAIRMAGSAVGAAGTYYQMNTYTKPWAQPANNGLGIYG